MSSRCHSGYVNHPLSPPIYLSPSPFHFSTLSCPLTKGGCLTRGTNESNRREVYNSQRKSTKVNESQQPSTTANNSQQQSTIANNSQQQSTTVNNSQQQSTTVSKYEQQKQTIRVEKSQRITKVGESGELKS